MSQNDTDSKQVDMTGYLLDTHAALWALDTTERLKHSTRELLENSALNFYISAASLWEIGIKATLGNLPPLSEEFLAELTKQRIAVLTIKPKHVLELQSLPMHHRDPFDRMLIAQAKAEKMTLVTNDRRIGLYDVPIVEA